MRIRRLPLQPYMYTPVFVEKVLFHILSERPFQNLLLGPASRTTQMPWPSVIPPTSVFFPA